MTGGNLEQSRQALELAKTHGELQMCEENTKLHFSKHPSLKLLAPTHALPSAEMPYFTESSLY